MIKEVLILAGLLALGTAATLYSSVVNNQECLSETEMWASEDIRQMYFCVNGTVYAENCPRNRYFVKNATVSGCIPAAKMNPNCVNTQSLGPCVGDNLLQPQVSSNPGNFYLCISEGATPVELSCPNNKAFIKQNGYLGCFDWSMWRQLRGCK